MQCVPDALAVLKQHGTNNGCTKVLWAERVAGVLHRESPVTLVNVRSFDPSTLLQLPVIALMRAGVQSRGRLVPTKAIRCLAEPAPPHRSGTPAPPAPLSHPRQVPEFLALWSKPAHRVKGYNRGWQRHLLAYAKQIHSGHLKAFSCGNCGDCNAKPPPAHNRSAATRIHLLEIAPANQRLLRHVIQATRLDDVVSLHPFGGSNASARVPIIKVLHVRCMRVACALRVHVVHACIRSRSYRVTSGRACWSERKLCGTIRPTRAFTWTW